MTRSTRSLAGSGPIATSGQRSSVASTSAAYLPPDQAYILARVEIAGEDSCWIWQLCTNEYGYGRAKWNGKVWLAHRLAWTAFRGDVPDELKVLHNCPTGDNPACCNPDHLWIGTQADNMRDMASKGRAASGEASSARLRGERNPNVKLSAAEVAEIRELYATGLCRYADLAERFGVSVSMIGSIIRGETWI